MKNLNTNITFPDLILTVLTIFVSIWFLFGLAGAATKINVSLLVYENGDLIKEKELVSNEVLAINLKNGRIKVEISTENGVRLVESDCPAKICVHSGWIKNSGQTIVCLPNKLLLELKGAIIKGEQEEYDAISY